MKSFVKIAVINVILFTSSIILAQNSLYMPRDVKPSYENGIRTYDGYPGDKYWQNSSDYKIKAELLPESSELKGEETITYHNNSPDSLDRLVIRLYADLFKKGSIRDWYGGTADMTDGVKLDYLIIGGDTVKFGGRSAYRGSTNIFAWLENKIAPNSTVDINVKWSLEIPDTFQVRMGNYGNNDFFVAYWYPQIAVYDDIDGWDMIDYSGIAEFYNDFNNYDFEITVPDNFVLWATGELQNPEDVYREKIIEKIKKAKISDETVRIITQEDYAKDGVTKKNGKNTWKFSAKNVTDVSFAASDNFNWDGASVVVDETTGRRVLTDAAYPDSTINWDKAASYARATIEYMSKDLPGVPYPYSHVTSFCNGNRGGGMETPMMANDGAPSSVGGTVGLIFHEIAHSYLPFYMGTNERKYAWMDEGWATFFPGEVVNRFAPERKYYAGMIRGYEYMAGMELELPLIVPTFALPSSSSRTASYSRPASAYYELQRLLGKELFQKCISEYIHRWHEKHPIPYDFFYSVENVAGQDLSWFWKPWFFEMGYPDLAIENVETEDDILTATVKKIGSIPTAVELTFYFDDDTTEKVSAAASVWKNSNLYSAKVESGKKLVKIELGSPLIPDVNRENNMKDF